MILGTILVSTTIRILPKLLSKCSAPLRRQPRWGFFEVLCYGRRRDVGRVAAQ